MKWVKWEDQGELAELIRFHIDTGCGRGILVENILKEHPEFTRIEIEKTISELKKKWLIINVGGGHFQVTEFSNSGIEKAMGKRDWIWCLKRLKDLGVHHPDMLRDRIITEQEEKEYREQNSTND